MSYRYALNAGFTHLTHSDFFLVFEMWEGLLATFGYCWSCEIDPNTESTKRKEIAYGILKISPCMGGKETPVWLSAHKDVSLRHMAALYNCIHWGKWVSFWTNTTYYDRRLCCWSCKRGGIEKGHLISVPISYTLSSSIKVTYPTLPPAAFSLSSNGGFCFHKWLFSLSTS